MRGGIIGRPERDASPQQRAVDHRLRRAILDAAIEELQMWSFERFSVETVADRAAVDRHVVHRLWNSAEQLMVDALVDHCDQVVIVPDTGSVRSDLAGHLASLAEYFNTGIGRSLLRTGVIGSTNWAPTRVRTYFWKARVDAVRIIFEKVQQKKEPPSTIPMELFRVSSENLGTWARQLKRWGFTDVPEKYLSLP